METLYLNNYRGFKEQTINFNRVNFFVGENSAGKTSVLKAISFLVSSELWFQNKIGDGLGFNGFSSVSDEKTFELGFISNDPNGTKRLVLTQIGNDNGEFILKQVFLLNTEWGCKLSYGKDKLKAIEIAKGRFIDALNSKNPESLFKTLLSDRFYGKATNADPRVPPFIAIGILRKDYSGSELGFIGECGVSAPIRATPQDFYSGRTRGETPEGTHIPYLFKNLSTKKGIDFGLMNTFGMESGLFEEIKINPLVKKERKSSPFKVEIKIKGKFYNMSDVGYGVSQILPLIVEPALNPHNLHSIQQPEVHLHPKAQAEYGTYLYRISEKNPKKQFFIETHSDFILDRFKHVASKPALIDEEIGKIHFFSKDAEKNKVESFPLNGDGENSSIPIGYREFFLQESINLLGI